MEQTKKIVIFGASGMIGTYLAKELNATCAVREVSKVKEGTFYWDPLTGQLDPKNLEGVDVVINLSGDSIASFVWNESKKKAIYESRIKATSLIAKTLQKMENPPKLLINASAIGYYGNRGDETLNEESSPGIGFLASVAQKWEEEAQTAGRKTKVVFLRFGIVLSPDGGMLKKILIPFKLGLGGRLGFGKQWMSWVDLREIDKIIRHIIVKDISGPVDVTSPNPVTNEDFTRILAEALNRPTLLNIPDNVLKFLGGDMADEMILASTKAMPDVLLKSGYQFEYPELKDSFGNL